MIAAGAWSLFVDCATAAVLVEIQAVAVGSSGQHKDPAGVVVLADDSGLLQTLGNLSWGFFGFKTVDKSHLDQVRQPDFYWHRTATSLTLLAQVFMKTQPGVRPVGV